MAEVLYNVADDVATITMNRPDALNAMTSSFMAELNEAILRVHDEPEVRVVVLTGAGRGFCAGADLVDRPARSDDRTTAQAMDEDFHPVIDALIDCPVPTVARINGPTAGAGIGVALACDIAVAASSAFFSATFGPKLGIVPDMGVTWHLPHLVGPAHARAIAMLGDRISADEAQRAGLIWKVADDAALDDAVGEIVDRLRFLSPEAMTRIRSAIAAAPHNTLREQLNVEAAHQNVLVPKNMGEGSRAFVEGRAPRFSGVRQPR
jgi:2-(1,2-epoxy-1,2-dihydrophenyl)acetyl-CoA isomerase